MNMDHVPELWKELRLEFKDNLWKKYEEKSYPFHEKNMRRRRKKLPPSIFYFRRKSYLHRKINYTNIRYRPPRANIFHFSGRITPLQPESYRAVP